MGERYKKMNFKFIFDKNQDFGTNFMETCPKIQLKLQLEADKKVITLVSTFDGHRVSCCEDIHFEQG